MIRALVALLAVMGAVLTMGCDCSGDFCVDVSRSFYSKEPCIGAPMEQCVYANVFFAALEKGLSVTDRKSLTVGMKINDREVGVETSNNLNPKNGLVVQLLLDQSYSITESRSTEGVRAAAITFLDSLPINSKVSVAVFASESDVPLFLDGNAEKSSSQTFFDSKVAIGLLQDYQSYPAATSTSQTKLYDAAVNLAKKKPSGEGFELLQHCMVVFTDGADTASTQFKTPADAADAIRKASSTLKVYAIGLGPEPKEEALNKLSANKFYRAKTTEELQPAFDLVSKQLTSIYLFKVLVAQTESDAKAWLSVKHGSNTVEKTFEMSSTVETAPAYSPVLASSSVEDSTWGKVRARDGRRSSIGGPRGWSSSALTKRDHPEWIVLDLGMIKPLTRVDLYPRDDPPSAGYGFPVDFKISLSTDLVEWVEVASREGEPLPLGVQSFSFTPQAAQFVKIEGTKLRSNPSDQNLYRMQFAEIEAIE